VAEQRSDQSLSSTAWSWSSTYKVFGVQGCSVEGCPFHEAPKCTQFFCCALNLSDALIQAGYTLPSAANVNKCAHLRVRNADGMARICDVQNGGKPDVSGWANRPDWKGIVYFEGNLLLETGELAATGHIDLWDGKQGVHQTYPTADTIWFWRLSN